VPADVPERAAPHGGPGRRGGDTPDALATLLADGRPEEVLARLDGPDGPPLDRLRGDPALAEMWVEAVRQVPAALAGARAGLVAVGRAHPGRTALAMRVSAALLRLAERRPADEPPLPEGPAADALAILEASPPGDGADAALRARHHGQRANALRMLGPARDAEARAALDAGLALTPDDGGLWADAALLHKWRGRWDEAFAAAERAADLLDAGRGVLWNLAIAATALGRGDRAADAWRALGLRARVNDAGMPIVEGADGQPLPPVDLRVPTRGSGHGLPRQDVPDRAMGFELLSVAPLSPCHGVVQSPSFRSAPVDWGDVVLWDGAPVGWLRSAGDAPPRPRFPLLEILRHSDDRRFRFLAVRPPAAPGPGGLRERVAAFQGALPADVIAFPFTETLERVAARVPVAGSVVARAERDGAEGGDDDEGPVIGKIVAPARVPLDVLAAGIPAAAAAAGLTVVVPELFEALGDARRAGKEHQAWRGLERRAHRRRSGGDSAAPEDGGDR